MKNFWEDSISDTSAIEVKIVEEPKGGKGVCYTILLILLLSVFINGIGFAIIIRLVPDLLGHKPEHHHHILDIEIPMTMEKKEDMLANPGNDEIIDVSADMLASTNNSKFNIYSPKEHFVRQWEVKYRAAALTRGLFIRTCGWNLDTVFIFVVRRYSDSDRYGQDRFLQDKLDPQCNVLVVRGIKTLTVTLIHEDQNYAKVYVAPDYWILADIHMAFVWASFLLPIIFTFLLANHMGYVRSMDDKEM